MSFHSCVHPSGHFIHGIHKPFFSVANLREKNYVDALGSGDDGGQIMNHANFPPGDVDEPHADPIFEIPNAFPFRGVTYISKSWADGKANNPSSISLPEPPSLSFCETIGQWFGETGLTPEKLDAVFRTLPKPLQLTVAATSTDADDLARLARLSCEFIYDDTTRRPCGLRYRAGKNHVQRPVIRDHTLYETIANNRFLSDDYKRVMVLKPGVQGGSEIVGETGDTETGGSSHVFEYLRRNSYIPWGHYAANMSDDAVRYRVRDLSEQDMTALRHLYYQRTYVRLARESGILGEVERRQMSEEELESLRLNILGFIQSNGQRKDISFTRTLWGWNFGFDYAASGYRLHASHQQIHQQFAMIPAVVSMGGGGEGQEAGDTMPAYACGDLIADFIRQYRKQTGQPFFGAYIRAIRNNRRMDGAANPSSLVIHEDENVMLFVPKAQTSQWEIQLMTLKPVGNILEADTRTRQSIDRAMRLGVQTLERMGAKMITSIEYSKSFTADADTDDQRLLYAFMPRLPESPGAFSEAQLRWINGHYPEDFAAACRHSLSCLPIIPKSV
ncbi:MAG: hypothetical protein C4518_02025 [Desulfobacteraceae bacterium]|nr:MAG: hypothetical protein C4518_02025 [Desulfobacteraceae bacterium]